MQNLLLVAVQAGVIACCNRLFGQGKVIADDTVTFLFPLRINPFGEPTGSRVTVDVGILHLDAAFLQLHQHVNGGDAGAACTEEIGLCAHPFFAEHLGKHLADGALGIVLRLGVFFIDSNVGLRQCLAVNLSCRCKRQSVSLLHGQWHHRGRHSREHLLPNRGKIERFLRNEECRYLQCSVVIGECRCRRFLHVLTVAESRLHSTQFHAEAPNLHHSVFPAQKLQRPVPAIAHHVASAEHAVEGRFVAERILGECRRRLLWPLVIALGHLTSRNPEFARRSNRHPSAARIDHI